jgi:molybdenum cofactor cytidylyltransferase
MFTLGRELAGTQSKVIVTTTTKLGADQVTEPSCWSDDPSVVEAALIRGEALFVATERIPDKITGSTPEMVDHLFSESTVDYVIVEADGARSQLVKAPASHEPVIPSLSTVVLVVAGLDAIGQQVTEVAHRPELMSELIGNGSDDVLTAAGLARVLLHPDGGLKGIPASARIVMVPTRLTFKDRETAAELVELLIAHPRVERVVPTPMIS